MHTDFSKVKQAKYIKLGREGKWDELCFKDGTLRLGYNEVPADYKISEGKQPIFDIYRPRSKNDQTATNHARQVYDFYAAGPETLWVTFSGGRMWWCQAAQEVEFLGADKTKHPDGSRLKRTLQGWSCETKSGKPLLINELSGRLTRSASYRQTICDIGKEAFEYLIGKLQDRDLPEVKETKDAKSSMLKAVEKLISLLTPQDFELFVDLLFTSSGWRRISSLGGTQKTIDMELVLPLTNERAFVQVKSKTDQQELDEYIEELSAMPADRTFYVYHTSKKSLKSSNKEISLLGPEQLAESAFRTGLVDWLIEKVG